MKEGSLALSQAVQDNDLTLATKLLRQGIDINQKDPLGYTPLIMASGQGNVQMVELLLTAGADVFILDSRMGTSALHQAAQSGVIDAARLLLQQSAFLDLQTPTLGYTPLISAVWYKRAPMVAYLVSQGAILSIRSHQGDTALDFARRDQLTDIIQILEEGEQAIHKQIEQQILHSAVKDNDISTIQKLLQQGADVNEKTPVIGGPDDGHTPLMIAAREGYEEVISILLTAKANPRIVDWLMKATPAHKAAYMGHAEVLRLLIENGGLEIDAQGPYNGYTALHDATWHGHTEAVQILLNAGANFELKGHDGYTPSEMAQVYGYQDILACIEIKRRESDATS